MEHAVSQAGSVTKHWTARRRRWRIWRSAFFLVIPFVIVYVAFLIYPTLRVVELSFTNSDITGKGSFVGLSNYIQLVKDPLFWASLWHTLYFILLTVVVNTGLGFVFALMVVRLKRFKGLALAAFFLPNILPVSVVTTIWLWILDSNFGIVDYVFKVHIQWFQDPAWAMPAVAFVTIWWTVGFNMLLFIAGLQGIPKTYYEAAEIDGASTTQTFWGITWPLMWPVTALVLTLQLILQFKIFNQVYLLTGGGPYNSTIVVLQYMYNTAFQQHHGGYASTIAIVLLIVILVASILQYRFLNPRRAS